MEERMSKVIAVAGKGGVGKTTLAALMVRYLTQEGISPVLAVDADPNSNLGETLGNPVTKTVGDIRENFMKDPQGVPSGMDKVNYLEMMMNQVLIEEKHYDLLVMGRQEGTGCYCMVNNILNKFMEKLSSDYRYLLVDNEAGMEHLSRRTSGNVDYLFLVTDYSLRGLRAVKRINSLLDELKLTVAEKGIVVTRAPETLGKAFMAEVEEIGLPIWGQIPSDDDLLEFDMERKSLMAMTEEALSVNATKQMMDQVLAG